MISLPAIPWVKLLRLAPYVLIALLSVALVVTRGTLAIARAEHRAIVTEIARKTEQARADDLAHARAVEAVQTKTTQEVSSAYQADIAALRARLDRLRASAGQGGSGGKNLPVVPNPAGRPDAAPSGDALPCDIGLMFEAESNTLQLMALQDWVRAQQKVAADAR